MNFLASQHVESVRSIVTIFTIIHLTGIIKASSNSQEKKRDFTLYAAGILPIVVRTGKEEDKNVSVILGKEAMHGFGKGQGEWSDLSGQTNLDEHSSWNVAFREANEEGRLEYVWKNNIQDKNWS